MIVMYWLSFSPTRVKAKDSASSCGLVKTSRKLAPLRSTRGAARKARLTISAVTPALTSTSKVLAAAACTSLNSW